MFLLVLLLVSCSHASHFYGTVMTYYPKDSFTNGPVTVILRYKSNFHSCISDKWSCTGNCADEMLITNPIKVEEMTSSWCQTETMISQLLPNNSPLTLEFSGGNWIANDDGIESWKAVTYVELRSRSDIGKANTSPQTTILPLLRVPRNCQRNISLLAFDPDGDDVRCRYASSSLSECANCTTPSVLNVSSSCTLSFSSSPNSSQYVVQMVMEDFSRQDITLTQTDGFQEAKNTITPLSKIPIQFAFKVDHAVPSCTEGLYLPRFLSPTPNNRAQFTTPTYQMLEIPIRAEATQTMSIELLVSGPYNVIKKYLGSGNFSLTWTPSVTEVGESHPICFVVQANDSSSVYQSELRCVIVTAEHSPKTTVTGPIAQPPNTRTMIPIPTTTIQPPTTTTTPIITSTTQPPPTTTTTMIYNPVPSSDYYIYSYDKNPATHPNYKSTCTYFNNPTSIPDYNTHVVFPNTALKNN
ncbi:uncharacterized protein V3H82_014060 [Fundulus diaphanus]